MELAEQRSPLGAEEILRRAYNERKDIGPMRKTASVMALSAAWRQARAMGSFNSDHAFTGRIIKGEDYGKSVVFEQVVPASQAPQFAAEIANYRLIEPSRARKADEAVSHRDAATLAGLESIAQEARRMDTVGLHAEAWQRDMEAAGELANQQPRVRIRMLTQATPARKNGDAWQTRVDLGNASDIPSEVTLHCYMIGRLWKSNDTYVMKRHTRQLKLRGNETRQLILSTPSRGQCKQMMDDHERLNKNERMVSELDYVGSLSVVEHDGTTLATAATYPSLLKILDEQQQFPSGIAIVGK
ncbi:hypothetical protein FEM03_21535 [Phragmitibacter flavus]|uniref:Uncharacterized protein n=1 Tax=Phragmitibacter flavus TaxID=2576071 RepID=A0A5R8K8G5_9BACT|nr:hypothetical protein [Phragmitibacter flavus]TLD68627.1 hypothetical protein FEM03_21535 [Phragmitibacter flavus]